MNKLFAIGLAACLPAGLAAEVPVDVPQSLGTVSVLVMDDSAPIGGEVACASSAIGTAGSPECDAIHRAVLSGRIRKVPALRERGRWL